MKQREHIRSIMRFMAGRMNAAQRLSLYLISLDSLCSLGVKIAAGT